MTSQPSRFSYFPPIQFPRHYPRPPSVPGLGMIDLIVCPLYIDTVLSLKSVSLKWLEPTLIHVPPRTGRVPHLPSPSHPRLLLQRERNRHDSLLAIGSTCFWWVNSYPPRTTCRGTGQEVRCSARNRKCRVFVFISPFHLCLQPYRSNMFSHTVLTTR
jgi:hypothetical protein